MNREAVTRIARVATVKHDGQIPPKSFASRADATVQRKAVNQAKAGQ